jgi:hypothetical protein
MRVDQEMPESFTAFPIESPSRRDGPPGEARE